MPVPLAFHIEEPAYRPPDIPLSVVKAIQSPLSLPCKTETKVIYPFILGICPESL